MFSQKRDPSDNRNFIQRYGSNIAGPFWFAGNAWLAAAKGFGGTWNETAAGVFNLAATFIPSLAGHTRYGMSVQASSSIFGMTLMQGPHLLAGDPLAWIGYGALILSASPVIAEPWLQSRAQAALAAWRPAKATLTTRAKSFMLQVLANSRLSYSVGGSACLIPLFANDTLHGRYHLLPVYTLLLTGNAINAFARAAPRPQPSLG